MKSFSKIAALFLGVVLTFGFVSCETETDNSLALAALALSSSSSGTVNPSTENTCTITFNANGGSITTATQTVTAGEKTALKSASELGLSRPNYAFVGWATKSDATEAEYNDAAEVTFTANLTLYALWAENVCTVTFNANGGTITTVTQTVKLGAKSKLKSATELGLNRTGYEFAGWATKSDATEAEYNDAAEVTLTDNLTLYALWIKLCTITFDANGGNITIATQVVKAGVPTKLKSAAELGLYKTNYIFTGWDKSTVASSSSGELYKFISLFNRSNDYNDEAEVTLTDDITLCAQWTEKICKITFDANGGTITTSIQMEIAGVAAALKTATELGLNRTNYTFAGWATKSGATTAEYADGAEVTLSDNLTLYAIWNELPVNEQPLTLEFIGAGTITISDKWSTLKYSLNGGELTVATDSITVAAGDKVCFYAQGSENVPKYQIIKCDADCYIYGNIMSLVTLTENGEWNPLETELNEECTFCALFRNNTHIKNHISKKLILPATKLTEGCYSEMFNGCTSLTAAPSLPAETLADYCYDSMFSRCTSLTTAPSLPAETLVEGCYESMFFGCTSLTTAPELKAETLATYCYESMFSGCTSLTTVPELKATTLAEYCCAEMFYGCTSLTTAPELKAETLADGCYFGMFRGCTSLTTAPELKATTLAEHCCDSMFYGCTSLTTAPELKATTLEGEGCYESMFYGCTNLNYVKCLATNISSTYCTDDWLKNVSTSGTFIKAKDMTSWRICASGIPSGWTVEDAE